jgi:hypothetical protein
MLAQRAVADSPRWTRAVEDQSAPIPEERTSKLGKIDLWSLAAALLDSLFEHPEALGASVPLVRFNGILCIK